MYVSAMTSEDEGSPADPVVARLLRFPSGLREGGRSDDHEVLATYWAENGDQPFAICRDGLLIDPEGDARFVPFGQIESAGYYDSATLQKEKRSKVRGDKPAEPLQITLQNGEVIILPLNARNDGMSERLTIAGLLEQRVRIHRPSKRNDPA